MFTYHAKDITADMDAAEEMLEHDRHEVETEKTYDDERQNQAVAVLNQMRNSVALVMSQSITLVIHTTQVFVWYFFVFCAVIFFTNIMKNTVYVYKQTLVLRFGLNVYTLIFQCLTTVGLFFFYLLFTLFRSYFEIDQTSIPFIVLALMLYELYIAVWNRDTQSKKIV